MSNATAAAGSPHPPDTGPTLHAMDAPTAAERIPVALYQDGAVPVRKFRFFVTHGVQGKERRIVSDYFAASIAEATRLLQERWGEDAVIEFQKEISI